MRSLLRPPLRWLPQVRQTAQQDHDVVHPDQIIIFFQSRGKLTDIGGEGEGLLLGASTEVNDSPLGRLGGSASGANVIRLSVQWLLEGRQLLRAAAAI